MSSEDSNSRRRTRRDHGDGDAEDSLSSGSRKKGKRNHSHSRSRRSSSRDEKSRRKHKKSRSSGRKSKRYHSESSSSSSDDDSSYEKRRRRKRKEKKSKKKKKKRRRESEDDVQGEIENKFEAEGLKNSQEKPASGAQISLPFPQEEQQHVPETKAKAMVPMSKEQYDAEQSKVRELYDEESGRYRLVRGSGEIIERIVSQADHARINQTATRGDGASFARGIFHASRR